MPSIKQADLDELKRVASAARDDAFTARQDADRLRAVNAIAVFAKEHKS